MKKGDHLVVGRIAYTHHGIYIGNGKVIHCSDDNGVEAISLDQFRQGKQLRVRHYDKSSYSLNERVKRAKSRLSENNYNLVTNNCEHFATWVSSGKHESKQVKNIATAVTSGVSIYVARRVTISEVSKEAAKYIAKKTISKTLANVTTRSASSIALTTAAESSTAVFTTSLATPAAPIVIAAALGVGAYYTISSWYD